jgi:KDO2-lipid IV(A) lauroyltransferase
MNTKELRRRTRFRAARALPGLLSWLPEGLGRGLCVWIGRGGHVLVGRDRRLARENLARVFPGWPAKRVRTEARRVFEEIGRNAFDFLRYPALEPEARRRLVRFEGREHLEAAVRDGRGAVIVTGHLGSWEVLAAALVEAGYPLLALARPLREARLDRALAEHRLRMGVRTLSSRALPLQALRHLRGGGFLGILADQRIKRGGVTVDFLGQRTRMTEGPARLAVASGAPLIPLGIHREPDHTHTVTVLPPISPSSDRDAGVLTQEVARALERLILRAPEQWIWIHPRWEGPAPTAESAPASRWLGGGTENGGPTCVSG